MVSQLVWHGYTGPDYFVMTWSDMRETASNCAELIEKTANVLDDDTLKLLFVSVQENNINLCIRFAVKQWVTCSLIRDHLLISQPSGFIERWKWQKGKVCLILWIWWIWYAIIFFRWCNSSTRARSTHSGLVPACLGMWRYSLEQAKHHPDGTGQIGKINAGGTHLHTLLNMLRKCWLETWCFMSRMWVFKGFSDQGKDDWWYMSCSTRCLSL